MDVLGEISLSNSRQSGFAKAAMECLLDSNLPAKYALTGCLSSNNIIQDGFYDCGPVNILFKLSAQIALVAADRYRQKVSRQSVRETTMEYFPFVADKVVRKLYKTKQLGLKCET